MSRSKVDCLSAMRVVWVSLIVLSPYPVSWHPTTRFNLTWSHFCFLCLMADNKVLLLCWFLSLASWGRKWNLQRSFYVNFGGIGTEPVIFLMFFLVTFNRSIVKNRWLGPRFCERIFYVRGIELNSSFVVHLLAKFLQHNQIKYSQPWRGAGHPHRAPIAITHIHTTKLSITE